MPNIGDVTSRLQADASGWIAGYRGAANATQDFARASALATEAADLVGKALPRIASDIAQASAGFKAGTVSVEDYRTALATARQELLQMAPVVRGQVPGALDELNGLLVKTAGNTRGLGTASVFASSGTGRLATAFGYMAAQGAGANFVVGRLISGLAIFGLGNPVAAGVLAAAAAAVALGGAVESVTKPFRDADKAADQLIATLAKQSQQAIPATIRALGEYGDVLARTKDKANEYASAAATLADVQKRITNNQTSIGSLVVIHAINQAAAAATSYNEALQAQVVALRAARGETKTNADLMKELEDAQRLAQLRVEHLGDSEQTLQLRLRGVSPEIIREAEALDRATMAAKDQATALNDVIDSMEKMREAVRQAEHDLQSGDLKTPGLPTMPSEPTALQTFTFAPIPTHAQLAGAVRDAEYQAEQAGKEIDRIIKDSTAVGDSLRETGRHDIEMLINGMVQGTADFGALLKKAMLDLISTAITKTIEVALGIASPSKVAMGWGQHVAEGLALGMAHGAPGAQRAATTLATLTFAPNISVGAARDPLSVARDADWQRAFRESALTAGSQGFRFPA